MSMNKRSRERVQRGTKIIHEELQSRNRFSVPFATNILREAGLYNQVRAITISRIGAQGAKHGLFGFDPNHGFWKGAVDVVSDDKAAQAGTTYLRSYIDQWLKDTVPASEGEALPAKKMSPVFRDRVLTSLHRLNDPDDSVDAVVLAQKLNDMTEPHDPVQWARLGAFRSFVRWGINNNVMTGNLDLLRVPVKLLAEVRWGGCRAIIAPATMTNQKNQWTWRVFDPDNNEAEFVGTPNELNNHLSTLNSATVDDEVLDFDDVLNAQGTPNIDYYDTNTLMVGLGAADTGQFADAGSSIPDDLLNRVVAADASGTMVSIPRPIAQRINQICEELQELLGIYT